MRLKGKHALITGGARGLGANIAEAFAQEGANVMVTDIDGDGAGKIADQINSKAGREVAFSSKLDVTDIENWQSVVALTEQKCGGMNVLVNNAGIVIVGSVETISIDDWRKTMSVNTDSVFFGCRASIPVMQKYGPGSIINVSSISALIASHNLAAYNTSKAAVWMLTKSVALYCARKKLDIRCNSIHPTFTKTPMLGDLSNGDVDQEQINARLAETVPIGRLGEPEDVSNAALYLASDESSFVTAAELKLDGGISAL